jgi:hypothetical protein
MQVGVHLPAYEDGTDRRQGITQKKTQRTEHGESLKSRILCFYSLFRMFVVSNVASAKQVFETCHLSQAVLKTIFPLQQLELFCDM